MREELDSREMRNGSNLNGGLDLEVVSNWFVLSIHTFSTASSLTVLAASLASLIMASHLASIYGTEQDKVNCSFYYKVSLRSQAPSPRIQSHD